MELNQLSENKLDHEKIFDEICGKLSQLSIKAESNSSQERLLRMQANLQKSQEELITAQNEMQIKLSSLDSHTIAQVDVEKDFRKLTEQLEQERGSTSKLSSDLARSLELNLKLQFEIEEVRSKMAQALNEEKKHNQYLADRNKNLSHEIELKDALSHDFKMELTKAKDRINHLQAEVQEHIHSVDQRDHLLEQMRRDLESRIEDIQKLANSLDQFEAHSVAQAEVLKNLSEAAEKKMIELKMALDKKSLEAQDYYSHLQQAMSQVSVLRQENSALKDYISKISNLHHQVSKTQAL